MPGWPVYTGGGYGGPVLVDLDVGTLHGDSGLEVLSVSEEGGIYAFDPDGSLLDGWPITTDLCHHVPMVGDVDGDGQVEILTDHYDYYLYAWNTECSNRRQRPACREWARSGALLGEPGRLRNAAPGLEGSRCQPARRAQHLDPAGGLGYCIRA